MHKEQLKSIIVDQRNTWQARINADAPVPRDHIPACRCFLAHPNILLVTGPRRAGKSFFARMLAGGQKAAFINFDDERLLEATVRDLQTIMECFHELYGGFTYALFDELQNIPGWELFAGRLRENYRVIITGSNARLLSREMATHLTGRFSEFVLFPMDFNEFLRFRGIAHNAESVYDTGQRAGLTAAFTEYLEQGGIFEHYRLGPEFLRSLWSAVINRDIITRYKVRRAAALERLALLALNASAAKLSASRLCRTLDLKSPHTIAEFMGYLENTFLLFTVPRFSYKLKEQMSTFKKTYVTDNGFIRALDLDFSVNRGRLLENLVAMTLKLEAYRTGTQLFYWDNGRAECDFVVKQGRRIVLAVQVCQQLHVGNEEREVAGLLEAMRECGLTEGLIVTDAEEDERTLHGKIIKILPAWKWLLAGGKPAGTI
jgi:hypothetical protein